jgi:hypothetical protein
MRYRLLTYYTKADVEINLSATLIELSQIV